jgi:hypothetical protein
MIRFADNLIVLDKGGIVYSGSPPERCEEIQATRSSYPETGEKFEVTETSDLPVLQQLQVDPKLSKHQIESETKDVQSRDLSVWKYYLKAIGGRRVMSAVALITLNVLASNFPST